MRASVAAEVIGLPWLQVALPMAILWNTTSRHLVRLVILSAFWLAIGGSLVGAAALPLPAYHVSALLQAIFFGLVFLRYGLLATMSATFTIETMLFAFPMFHIFRRIDPLPYSLWICVWVLMLLLSATLYFRPQLEAARRRVAAVFE